MAEPLVFLNGRILPQSQAGLTLHDAGFVMGATVTDLCRTVRHALYRWPDHLARFESSCRSASISLPLSESEITECAEDLVRRNLAEAPSAQDLALVVFATPGPVGYYLGHAGGVGVGPVTFGMHTFPLPLERYRHGIEHGATLVVPSVRQLPPVCVDPHIKMRSRMHWYLAEREAQRLEPGALALLLDQDGLITETAAANVLFVLDGKVISPPFARILEGISLRVVAELCRKLGISFEERPLTLRDLAQVEEAMLTSTPYFLMGVRRCQGVTFSWPGNVYRRLLQAWGEEAGMDLHGQILLPK